MENSLPATCPCRELDEHKPSYAQCCQPFHLGRRNKTVLPETAQALMRSRYSAFVLLLEQYLLDTWHVSTRPQDLGLDEELEWSGLEIIKTRAGGAQASRGVVEFTAHYGRGANAGSQHEVSTFVKEDGAWYYVDAL